MTADELFDSYRDRGHTSPGGELWLPYDPARQFIDDCEKLGFVILGADFVIRDDSGILPVSTADYTTGGAKPSVEETARDLRDLIREGFPEGANEVSIVIARPGSF